MSTIYRYRLTTVVKETRLNRGECKGNAAKRLVKDSDKNGRLLLTIFQTFEKKHYITVWKSRERERKAESSFKP